MSGPISRNGVFLGDHARAKKALEEERRILRLQQVRTESRNIARKIRNDVAAEKQRQLRNLQTIKEQELEVWRRSVLLQKYDDYRSAVFHIGDAHAAARAENAEKPKSQESLFRRQVRARRSYNKYDTSPIKNLKTDKANLAADKLRNPRTQPVVVINKSTFTQTVSNENENKKLITDYHRDTGVQLNEDSPNSSNKRKRHSCENRKDCGTQHDCVDSDDSEELDSCCRVSECSISDWEKENTIVNKLMRTPAVVFQVENKQLYGKDDQKASEMHDNFVRNNRQFSHIVSDNKVTNVKPIEKNAEPRFTQVTKLLQKKSLSESQAVRTNTEPEPRKFIPPNYKHAVTIHASKISRAPIPAPNPLIVERKKIPIKTQTAKFYKPTSTVAVHSESRIPLPIEAIIEEDEHTPRTNVPVPSPSKILRETSPTARMQLYSEASVILDPSELKTDRTVLQKALLRQEQIKKIREERDKACQDIQLLTEKLAGLAHDCCTSDTMGEIGSTYRKPIVASTTPPQTPKKVPELIDRALSAPASPVARSKVDRASSPTQNVLDIEKVDRASSASVKKHSTEMVDRGSSPLVLITSDNETSQKVKITETKIKKSPPKQIPKRKEKTKTAKELPFVDYDEQKKSNTVVPKDPHIRKSATNAEQNTTYSMVLLDYAADQSKILSKDLNEELSRSAPNKDLCEKLRNLLKHNEKLRKKLIEKLERTQILKFTEVDNEEAKAIITEMCTVRHERERLLTDSLLVPEKQREVELKAKEMDLQQRESYLEKQKDIQKQHHEHSLQNEPVEIVITVKGAKPLEGSMFAGNKEDKVQLRINASDCQRIQQQISKPSTPLPPTKSPAVERAQEQNNKDNLYDSESTHYRSLPKQIQNTLDDDADEQTLVNIESPDDEVIIDNCLPQDPPERKRSVNIDPIVKQYVDRLLSMRRSSVLALGISASEVETPNNSIINTTSNQMQISSEFSNSQKYFDYAEHFIEENYKFLDHLEQSLVDKKNASLEKSMQITEDLWIQQFGQEINKQSTAKKMRSTSEHRINNERSSSSSAAKIVEVIKETVKKVAQAQPEEDYDETNNTKQERKVKSKTVPNKETLSSNQTEPTEDGFIFKKPFSKAIKKLSTRGKIENKENDKKTTMIKSPKKERRHILESTSQVKLAIEDDLNDSDTKIRFKELANNCSQRINELNNMITRVREEKTRLVESTYSSLSIPSPEPPSPTPKITGKSHEDEEEESNSLNLHALPDRHAALTGSHDSGIGQSRPATRQEAFGEEQEPTSCETAAPITSIARHSKPPAVLKRFSPQLDEELAVHELSTIAEVDTPITSRVHTATTGRSEPDTVFEQYVQENHLDLSSLPEELHNLLEDEFSTFMSSLRKRKSIGVSSYKEFPSILSYLNQISNGEIKETSVILCETSQQAIDDRVDELINCLRLATLSIKSFPSPREYARRLHENSNSLDMLDTESLENISEESDSDTMNIEEELRNRKLLREPFQTQNNDAQSNDTLHIDISASSKHSTKSPDTASKSQYNLGTGGWAGTMIRRMQETNALSSGTSPTPEKQAQVSKSGKNKNHSTNLSNSQPSVGDDTIDSLGGRGLNLRDFLQRELSRYCNTTSGSTSSPSPSLDFSLRHQFFSSILDSMTPKTQPSTGNGIAAPPTSKNTDPSTSQGLSITSSDHLAHNRSIIGTQSYLARHKTSTPVQNSNSRTQNNTTSTSSTLFSCESHISSVADPKQKKTKKLHLKNDKP